MVVSGAYPAYISYDQYLLNRWHLQDNLYNFTAMAVGPGPRHSGSPPKILRALPSSVLAIVAVELV